MLVCDFWFKCYENVPFFKQGLTVVEKWILYNNVELKRLWSNQKQQSVIIAMADLYPNEVMPCFQVGFKRSPLWVPSEKQMWELKKSASKLRQFKTYR